jgi:hypothetical protein
VILFSCATHTDTSDAHTARTDAHNTDHIDAHTDHTDAHNTDHNDATIITPTGCRDPWLTQSTWEEGDDDGEWVPATETSVMWVQRDEGLPNLEIVNY